jgi:hypothetical protein
MKIVFIEDFSVNKKGDVKEFSKDIAYIFINELKVATLFTENETKEKPKKEPKK